jgi:DNA repair exonuclease SbcCD ATPase subunit
MGPKTAANKSPETLEDVISVLKSLSAKFDTFSTKLTSVETLSKQVKAMDTKIASLEAKLVDVLETNKTLKAEIQAKDKALDNLSSSYTNLVSRCNELEQYNRSWSVRVFNIPLSDKEEKDRTTTKEKTYELAFLPILQGALEAGEISAIPSAEELLETAHVLPSKPGSIKPVIARFYNCSLHTLCLRRKRDFATKTPRGPATGSTTRTITGGAAVGVCGGGGEILQPLL